MQLGTLILIVAFVVCSSGDNAKLPEGISRELYCTGCQLTVKAIDKDLSHHTGENMNQRINNLMNKLCRKEYFDSHEAGADKLVKICKHLIENYRFDLHGVLKKHYSGRSRLGQSYLCMSQKICRYVTPACKGFGDEKGTEMNCDDDIEGDFMKHIEKNAKKANPVHEGVMRNRLHNRHDEL